MKKTLALLLAIVIVFGLAACGSGGDAAGEKDPGSGAAAPGEVVEVSWWTNYGALNVEYIQQIIDAFNESQDSYHVTIERQGGGTELKAKLRATKAENLPAMFSGTPATTSLYANSNFTACFQDFLDADEENWTEDLYAGIRTSYCDETGRMWGFPFGVSCTGIWVNEDLLAAAGYSLSDLTSFETVVEAAVAVKAGGHAAYGIGFHKDGTYLSDMLTMQGVDVLDKGNGYDALATKCLYQEGETYEALKKALSLYAELYSAKAGVPYGTDVNGEIIPQFAAGNVAMFYGTNSYAGKLLESGCGFKYSFIPSVRVDGSGPANSIITAGTGNYISSGASPAAQQGAYEFIKFASQPQWQSFWCQSTGYIPYTGACSEDEGYVSWMNSSFPSAAALSERLLDADEVVRGPYVSISTDMVNANVLMVDTIYSDPAVDLDTVIKTAADSINEAIEIANLSR